VDQATYVNRDEKYRAHMTTWWDCTKEDCEEYREDADCKDDWRLRNTGADG